MKPEEVWRRKTDEEVAAAAQNLEEYTEAGREAILAELERRGLTTEGIPTGSTQARGATTLSTEIQGKVALLFSAEEREAVIRLLLDLQKDFSEVEEGAFGIERVQSAALRVSHGQLERLRKAIGVGRMDFRDLLSAAGFGSLHAHERWQPTPGKVSRWERFRERFFGIP